MRKSCVIGCLSFLLFFCACGEDRRVEDVVAAQAREYYDCLLGGDYESFLEGFSEVDSMPADYREQLLTNVSHFMGQQKKEHKHIERVEALKAVVDTATHQATAFLLLCFGDSLREEVAVPLIECRDGRWRMR